MADIKKEDITVVFRRKKCYIKILVSSIAAAVTVAAVFCVLYIRGAFLPDWVIWKDKEPFFELDDNVRLQDYCMADIDMDGDDELIVLCWKIGKYGERKPFWVKADELKWSQHIYIYEVDNEDITPKWMASDIHQEIMEFAPYKGIMLEDTAPDGVKSYWMWDTWGLYRVEKDEADRIALAYEKKGSALQSGNTAIDARADDEDNDKIKEDEEEKSVSDSNESKEDASEDKSVSVIMAGDILLHDGVNSSCRDEAGNYDYSVLFEHTKDHIQNADIAIVNEEVIIGGRDLEVTGYPCFNAPYEIADALSAAGFDVVCHATNHALDRGKRGILNCLKYWREKHPDMDVIGIYDNEDDYNSIYIKEVNGIRIAILNYTYGTNGISLPEDMPYIVSLLDENKLINDLKEAESAADFTIVCPHWGTEYSLKADDYQKKSALLMTENGADLIIGTHPHVVEPVEWIEADNGNRALCYYSIGNYVSWSSGRSADAANRIVGALAIVNIKEHEGMPEIEEYELVPTITQLESHYKGVTTYLLKDYTDELADKNEIRKINPSFDVDYCRDLIYEVTGKSRID